MPSRRAIIASGAGLAVAVLGYRAWDRGVFTGARGEPYEPWDEWRGGAIDGRQRPLHAAILAASPHDTQPWLFSVSDSEIAVFADRARHLGAFDPFRRELHLGVGCAIENLVCAARAFGVATDVEAMPGTLELSPSPEPVMAARVALGAAQPERDALFDAIPNRHTHRGLYREDAPAPARLREYVDLVSDLGVRVVFVSDDGARRELGELIVAATEQIVADSEMSHDSFRWIRTGRRDIAAQRDGVTIDASGVNRLMTIAGKMLPDLDAEATDKIWLKATRDLHTATAPVYGMILVQQRLDMVEAIAAGRAWQRLHLAMTTHGLAAQPLNQPVEMIDRSEMLGRSSEFPVALAKLADADGWEPTFVFRLGNASREAPRSPRRPLSEVIISQDVRAASE